MAAVLIRWSSAITVSDPSVRGQTVIGTMSIAWRTPPGSTRVLSRRGPPELAVPLAGLLRVFVAVAHPCRWARAVAVSLVGEPRCVTRSASATTIRYEHR